MIAGSVHRIARLNYVIGGVLIIAAALTQNGRDALGVAVGVALSCLNFFLLDRLVGRWTSDAAAGRPTAGSALLMMPKMILLMGAVIACLALLPISGAGFVIGYSVFVVSILVELVLSAALPTPAPTEGENHG